MDRTEFLEALREKLNEGMSDREIEEQINYYADYIGQEVQNGKLETQVLEELGNPTLLARTILDTQGRSGAEFIAESAQQEQSESRESQGREFYVNSNGGWGCIAAIIIAALVIGIVLWLVGSIFRVLSPILVPILIVVLIVMLVKKR